MWALVRHFRHYPSIFRRMSRKSECDYRMSLKTPENASTTWPSSGKMLPWRRGVGSFLALAAFVAVVTLTIAQSRCSACKTTKPRCAGLLHRRAPDIVLPGASSGAGLRERQYLPAESCSPSSPVGLWEGAGRSLARGGRGRAGKGRARSRQRNLSEPYELMLRLPHKDGVL